MTSVSKDVEKKEPSCTAGGMQTGTASVEYSTEFPQKTENEAPI